jgi:pimeloyl-ACP methyl ester carboxylesterase
MLSPGWLHRLARRGAESLGLAPRAELDALAHALVALRRPERRRALLNTLRGGVSWGGQRVDATDRLYLLTELPTLFIAGRQDRCIPHEHALRAHAMLPGSRLELLEAGHFPHSEHAERVGELIAEFVAGGAAAPVTALRFEPQPELCLQA